jgi:thiosulfate/3-mercaptopyruvate sulfurtransferase
MDSILGKTLVSVPDAMVVANNVKFIDGSWFLGADRNAQQEYIQGPRIAGARFLDIDEISSRTPDQLPHMMPTPAVFAATMDAYDISNQDHVIVYGSKDCMFVARGFWQMRVMGHPKERCHLLDGSLEDWMQAGGPVEAKGTAPSYPVVDYEQATKMAESDPSSIQYQAKQPQNIVDLEELKSLIAQGKTTTATDVDDKVTVVDVRSSARFNAEVDEPRPGLRLGHMPGAKNLFFLDLLNPDNKVRLKSKDELRKLVENAGITLPLQNKVIATCGSGATACVLLLALDVLGENPSQLYLYDGSWAQWGSQPDTPIVKD